MKLGTFSVSLSVKDLATSQKFYEHLGFEVMGGDPERNYLILKNEDAIIGLFQGMFEGNILTFNPGWDQDANDLDVFEDVREIQRKLSAAGMDTGEAIETGTSGPASFTVTDPDGNVILIDQHR
ncbi:VOC family protein [Lewinella sp. W8]|uniref:VOC family protein n=1 Tax=Lewinella sp. W8 TaxID=2528208 RepID=UPI001067E2B7|nr:VOC family protein [Lewinella sp. W8]MTB53862.1 VOC family protein [Lewinella sp. W8]